MTAKASTVMREEALADEIRIEFTRFSAFYSPLIATMAGGFLKAEGLEGKHSVSPPGKSAIAGLLDGSVHVAQSAPCQGFTPLEQGKQPPALHFAQINEKDGFFLTGRSPDPAFGWDKLKGKKVIVDHGGQPMAMFKYACFKRGLDFKAIEAIDAGSTDKMIAAFRAGQGDFIHLQGPAPQQLEHDKVGHIVAVGGRRHRPLRLLEPRRHARLAQDRHGQGLHARLPQGARLADRHAGGRGGQGRGAVLQGHRPGRADGHHRHLSEARQLEPHVEITRPAFEATLDIFQHAGLITKRHKYEDVIAPAAGVNAVGRNKAIAALRRFARPVHRRNALSPIAPYAHTPSTN